MTAVSRLASESLAVTDRNEVRDAAVRCNVAPRSGAELRREEETSLRAHITLSG
jgi:hypothetical protein